MRMQQRLVICLDGTWNKRDDSTNVLHHDALAIMGDIAGPDGRIVHQDIHYDEGVGTSKLDVISGGAFGLGLEEKVRGAYDWLVANYHDASDDVADDEIYVFGFSRGAYTARSLVGFIASCGLLRRGAPLTVGQLWTRYGKIERQREKRQGLMDILFRGRNHKAPYRITDLVADPWNRERTISAPDDLGLTDQLLVQWSRRVKITYLGIYDTVGAMGIDALAIPGLSSKLSLHHNMNPTTIIQSCRHALAIDEHRSSFHHTPYLMYQENGLGHRSAAEAAAYWQNDAATWNDKIEQRWFIGAHSNVGGGYADNELAQITLGWVLEGAIRQGLRCEPFSAPASITRADPVDSYNEFLGGVWSRIIRGKRSYRAIDPEPELRAGIRRLSLSDRLIDVVKPIRPFPAGYSLVPIHEALDASVHRFSGQSYLLKNPALAAYENRKGAEPPSVPGHVWLTAGAWSTIIVLFWASLAGLGVKGVADLVLVPMPAVWVIVGVAVFFVVVDWAESVVNQAVAVGHPVQAILPRQKALLDCLYWVRSFGVVMFCVGALYALAHCLAIGWKSSGPSLVLSSSVADLRKWFAIPICAGIMVFLLSLFEGQGKKRISHVCLGLALGAGFIIICPLIGLLAHTLLRPVVHCISLPGVCSTPQAQFAGMLLVLEAGLLYFVDSTKWVGESMERTNLGSIVRLQLRATPSSVRRCLDDWRDGLTVQWGGSDAKLAAGRQMRAVVRECLWRDIFGYIPIYGTVLTLGLYFVVYQLGGGFLQNRALTWLWWAIPAVIMGVDWIEDLFHLSYLKADEQHDFRAKSAPGTVIRIFPLIPFLSFCCSIVKMALFFPALIATIGAILYGGYKLMTDHVYGGWRATAALTVWWSLAMLPLLVLAWAGIYRLTQKSQEAQVLAKKAGQ